jgi:hypothetical protein
MLAGRASGIESLKDKLNMIADFLSLRDYDRAEKLATDNIIKRQSRGSVFAQSGWYLTKTMLQKKSHEADRHMRNLRAALRKAQS